MTADLNIEALRASDFSTLAGLIAIVSDPKAAEARAREMQQTLAAIADERSKLASDRSAFAEETDKAKAEIAADSARATGVWRRAEEAKFMAEGLQDRAEAYAAKVGYREPPSTIAVGTNGLTMSVFPEEAPAAPEIVRPPRLSEQRFGATSLTRAVEESEAPAGARVRGRA